MNRHQAAIEVQRGPQLFERGVGSLSDQLVQALHPRPVQRGGIMPPRQRRGATVMSKTMQPTLKCRKVYAIEFRYMRLRAAARLVGPDRAFPDFSAGDAHTPIMTISLLHVNAKML